MQNIAYELAQHFGSEKGRCRLMEMYGDTKTIFRGANSNDEAIDLSISHNGIQVTTYQDNGWLRVDIYDAQGNKESERFDGRWRYRKKCKAEPVSDSGAIPKSLQEAAETLNPNYSTRHNDIIFASDVCKAVLRNASLSKDLKQKLQSAIQTLDTIARR